MHQPCQLLTWRRPGPKPLRPQPSAAASSRSGGRGRTHPRCSCTPAWCARSLQGQQGARAWREAHTGSIVPKEGQLALGRCAPTQRCRTCTSLGPQCGALRVVPLPQRQQPPGAHCGRGRTGRGPRRSAGTAAHRWCAWPAAQAAKQKRVFRRGSGREEHDGVS